MNEVQEANKVLEEYAGPDSSFIDMGNLFFAATAYKEAAEKLAEALDLQIRRREHSCNIEYGNNTGVENCVKCNAIKALKEYRE